VADLGSLQAFGATVPTRITLGNGINDSGQVVGFSFASKDRAFVWDEATGMNFIGEAADYRVDTRAQDINNAGQIAGNRGARAVRYDPTDGYVELAEAFETFPFGSRAYAINELGQIAGEVRTPTDPNWTPAIPVFPSTILQAARWDDPDTLVTLGVLPGFEDGSRAYGLNDLGQVVGQSYGGDRGSAVFWNSDGAMTDLGALLGAVQSSGFDVNNAGTVVGNALNAGATGTFGWVWDADLGMRDLNDYVDPASGFTIRAAHAINEAGVIVGDGRFASSDGVFVLTPNADSVPPTTPVPAPPALALMIAGVAAILGLGRRRR
jgi:probable HAF family extracellular repeat protein